jgi:hypothetical protein
MLIKAKLRFPFKIKIKSKIEGSVEKPRKYLGLQSAMVQKNKSSSSSSTKENKKSDMFSFEVGYHLDKRKPIQSGKINVTILDVDKSRVAILPSIKIQKKIGCSIKNPKVSIKGPIEKSKVDLGLTTDNKKKIKSTSSIEEKKKTKGRIIFQVDDNLDIKKPAIENPKVSGKLKISVLDADRMIKFFSSIKTKRKIERSIESIKLNL